MSRARIEVETFQIPCKVYGCTSRSKYKVGHPSGAPNMLFHVCESCLQSMIDSLPQEMLPTVEVEKEVEVIKEVIKEVNVYPTAEELDKLLEEREKMKTTIPKKSGKKATVIKGAE